MQTETLSATPRVLRVKNGETPDVQAGGEPVLLVSYTSTYTWLWNDEGSDADQDVTIWRPNPDSGYYILGDYAQNNYGNPTGTSIVVKVVNDDPNNPLVKAPTDYRNVWKDKGSDGDNDGSVWYPVPPDGYISLGFVGQEGYDKPDIANYACVRRDLVTQTSSGALIWNDAGSGADTDVSLYQIVGVGNAFVAQANHDPYLGTCYQLKST